MITDARRSRQGTLDKQGLNVTRREGACLGSCLGELRENERLVVERETLNA